MSPRLKNIPPAPPGITYTTDEAAAMIGRLPHTVRKVATNHKIGTRIHSRLRVFTAADVATLRAICRGTPGPKPKTHLPRD